MESKAKAFGHPIHQMLIVYPLGLLTSAVIVDIIRLITGYSVLSFVAFVMLVGGIIGGLTAAVFGFWDWLHIPAGTRAKAIGLWHGVGNVVVVVLFAVSALLRWSAPEYTPGILAFLLGLVGLGLGSVTGWLGGELVDRLGVGVDPGANLNAPSSLSGQPATVGRTSETSAHSGAK